MAKERSVFSCNTCGGTSPKWLGKCPHCGAWNTLIETVAPTEASGKNRFASLAKTAEVAVLSEIEASDVDRTPTGHEVTMPNAILTGSAVANFSRFDPAAGPVIATAVTIGYDTPWRQVHALLELAASRTPGVDRSTPPVVVQTGLTDFYAEYQLRCRIERVEERNRVLSDLHARIQDAFNEFGVQIMSPHFNSQPAQPVLVAKGQEAPPPARS